jgi:apolipoprotein N-acyltransferase
MIRPRLPNDSPFAGRVGIPRWGAIIFGDTAAPHQHLAQATLRAVENRVPVVRVANTGISAVITPDGAIAWQGPLFEEAWHVATVAGRSGRTVYTRVGDVFVGP